jgi:hypothetical protein
MAIKIISRYNEWDKDTGKHFKINNMQNDNQIHGVLKLMLNYQKR